MQGMRANERECTVLLLTLVIGACGGTGASSPTDASRKDSSLDETPGKDAAALDARSDGNQSRDIARDWPDVRGVAETNSWQARDGSGDTSVAGDAMEAEAEPPPCTVYVASDVGDDGNDGVSGRTAVATITRGLSVAKEHRCKEIRVAGGRYVEPATLQMGDGVGLMGGFDSATWTVGLAFQTLVSVLPSSSSADTVLVASNLTKSTTVANLHLNGGLPAKALAGSSSYVVRVVNSPAVDIGSPDGGSCVSSNQNSSSCVPLLHLLNCVISAGDGKDGTAGNDGATQSCGANLGGVGGTAFDCGNNPAAPGGSSDPLVAAGIAGDSGGTNMCNSCHDPGSADNGQNGGDGHDGPNGTQGVSVPGDFDASTGLWCAAQCAKGGDGWEGSGGGGGGGGGTMHSGAGCATPGHSLIGGAGGKGGDGGCRGSGGQGGLGGGGSFGVVLVNSSIDLTGSQIVLGKGGKGGAGGVGANGTGGKPGVVGSAGNEWDFWLFGTLYYYGGNGGTGGHGGSGGAGAGGNGGDGGPSAGVVSIGRSSCTAGALNCSQRCTGGVGGTGGARGAGGTSGAGKAGAAGADGKSPVPVEVMTVSG